MRLKGKVAIITGSTSGMGRASAVLFAQEGAKVTVVGRNAKRGQEVVDEIKKNGGEAIFVAADMTNMQEVAAIADKTVEAFGTVDILFNNAGQLSITPLATVSLEEWNSTFAVNVTAQLVLAQKVAPIMKAKGKGSIINTSSVAGYAGHNGLAAYVASKHACRGLTRSMAWELGPEIRANAIAPGAIHTAMLDSVGGPAGVQGMIDGAPLKRVGQGIDIATAALFLASDDSAFVTGQCLKVDGGWEV